MDLCGVLTSIVFVGAVPASLCQISLTSIALTFNDANPLLTCAYSCLTAATTFLPDGVCTDALCGFIAATNIASITGYDEWSCSTYGATSTNPCADGSEWTGVSCSSADVVDSIDVSSLGLTGTLRQCIIVLLSLTGTLYPVISLLNFATGSLPTELAGFTSLTSISVHDNNMNGKLFTLFLL